MNASIPEVTQEIKSKNVVAVSDPNTQVPPPKEEDVFATGSLPGGKYSKLGVKKPLPKPLPKPAPVLVESEPVDDSPVMSDAEINAGVDGMFAPFDESEADTETINLPSLELAYYGIAGRIIRKIAPETEADPAGMLVELLINLGSVTGRGPYYRVNATNHYTNLFAVRVGATSRSRKGTAGDYIAEVMKLVDSTWFNTRRGSGLSTGEGMIEQIHDEVIDDKGNVAVPEIADKRLQVTENEFSQPMIVMQRPGNNLGEFIRKAFDSQSLQSMVKGSPRRVDEPHISIMGNITREELNLTLTPVNIHNGFTNRFLWPYCRRQGLKSFGGSDLTWTSEVAELKKAIAFAKTQKRVWFDRNARLLWDRVYKQLTLETGRPGTWGAATSRGEAHVVRIALIFALLDCSTHIRFEHLKAALVLWKYCDESARYIFGELSERQSKIERELKGQCLTAGQMRRHVFHDNVRSGELLADLAVLLKRSRIMVQQDQKNGTELYCGPR